MNTKVRNIFVIGLDPFNLKFLRNVRNADNYAFHELLDYDEIAGARRFDMEALLEKARRILRAFPDDIHAIVGYWDFPGVLMMPILRAEFGLRGPSLESVLMCEHKYLARVEQKRIVPDQVPDFALVDPFEEAVQDGISLDYPYWIKPVKAHSSILGFRIDKLDDLRRALPLIREKIDRFSEPLDVILGYADLPEDVPHIHGAHCIAEEIISKGHQCTLEGYVFEGDVEVYGIVDSHRGPNNSSMERYEYPSALPEPVKARMRHSARLVLKDIGFNDSPFNMEFYYHKEHDSLAILEINARISKSHSPIFDKVEGVPHKEVMIDVALGRRPDYPARRGEFGYAAKFMPRLYGEQDDAVVTHAPDEDQIREVAERFPGADINLHVHEGMRMAELSSNHRDSYSYQLADIFMGATSREALNSDFAELMAALDIRIDDERMRPQ
ncbi:MAG: D-alanine--D-alanine ligase [Spiribacter salinus]|uniref:D-alanine--D-alanine ligase n=1 Tax=Spiribacter salinus TaxID=1335746 RepID=A0A540VM09_9GAMM|nr:MAG: D-alanine--D-alanine ligase [Spiribacter salinus]